MAGRATFLLVALAAGACLELVHCNPLLEVKPRGADYVPFNACMQNCVQCKSLYWNRFQGQRCGEACIRNNFFIPDCREFIAMDPFITDV